MFLMKFMKKLEKSLNKINGWLSIARKAGYCIIGQDKLLDYDKKLFLIVIDKVAGKSLEREMRHLSQEKNLPLIYVENLAQILGIENCKVVGIKNKSISEQLIESLKGEI